MEDQREPTSGETPEVELTYAEGGWIRPGATMAINGCGYAERVRTLLSVEELNEMVANSLNHLTK